MLGALLLLTLELLALTSDVSYLSLCLECVEGLTGRRGTIESKYLDRHGWSDRLDCIAVLIEECLHTTIVGSGDDVVSIVKCTLLDQDLGGVATTLLKRTLKDGPLGELIRVGL